MNSLAPLALIAGLASTSIAQTGTATWQVSADNGATWGAAVTIESPQPIRVRLVMSWSGIPNAVCYGGSQLDAFIITSSIGDAVADILRPSPFAFAAQTLVASLYSEGIKIDAAGDNNTPGLGSGWVNPGQGSPDGGIPNTSNPAVVFTYTLHASVDQGTRLISHVFNPSSGRAMAIYTNPNSVYRFSANQVTINTATVTVIPTPAAASCAPLVCAIACRRRRRVET